MHVDWRSAATLLSLLWGMGGGWGWVGMVGGWWVVGWGHSKGGEVTLDGGEREVAWSLVAVDVSLLFLHLTPAKHHARTDNART